MARPTTKSELLQKASEQFDKMEGLIDAMEEEAREAHFAFGEKVGKEAHWQRDKTLRDVLAHLYEWHLLLLNWVAANKSGDAKPFLPEPYTWKTYADMNVGFFQKHQATPYDEARRRLSDSHAQVLALIERFSNEELFENRHFNWTGTTSLGSYCVSATVSHYEWAMKKIRLHMKTYGAQPGGAGRRP